MLKIRGGRVLDPASGRDEIADIWVENGRIVQIGGTYCGDESGEDTTVEAAGLVVAPGLIDTHVHFRPMFYSFNVKRSLHCP